ncbi:transglutaminase domain-containing protein [Solibacillus sp. MA9]|uniref:Transglutaminase domain-containing protein n=1 Tax=Solibacillus palustris TaxID=2908203 RepID=A0ABS9UI14_9BACL|nr:transglutaminase domain-containing protein [Solibacillus sp. MA9]MCH7323991.1 transglutaminase domain-containing protein [Solibacillus sp. MA9]
MKRSTSEKIELAVFYIIILLILREWLMPIVQLTNTGYFTQFLLFMAICLTIGVFSLPIILSWSLKILYITWFIVSVYNRGELTTMQFLSNELRYNIDVLITGDWVLVSDPFRTSLFFILIWMLIYLIQHWVSVRHTVYYFLVLTVFFIGTLDTFTEYDGTVAIIKVMILGLVLTSLLFIKRIMHSANMQKDWGSYLLFATPIILFVTIAGLAATFLPKAEPQWPDPVPYIKGMVGLGDSSSSGSVATVGYGDNDESLGGPFVGDDTVVYEIETPIRQYWRVETKDFYTSKGWLHTSEQDFTEYVRFSEPINFSITPGNVEPQLVQVNTVGDYNFLLQAYGTTTYQTDEVADYLAFNYANEKMQLTLDDEIVKPTNYEITFQQPEYNYTALKETVSSTESDQRYLQLPEQLPRRVIDLAHEITGGYESVYDKARAIEDYFARSGFKYETKNVSQPAKDEDYVDQFLFETMLGYCDNFSTSMVVMLRSVGIQARWVKGFASGERVASSDGMTTYRVTNNDAHSWVEAYIDGIGWMPFEPTIGFSNPMNIDYDIEIAPDEEQLPEPETPEVERPQPEEQETTAGGNKKLAIDFAKYKWVFYVLGAVLIVGAIIAWRMRGKWQPKLAVQMNRSKLNNLDQFEDVYFVLLKQLERIYLKRGTHETLQNFAIRVDRALETTKMSELTAVYEQYIYAGNSHNFDTTKVKENWEYLINRTSN